MFVVLRIGRKLLRLPGTRVRMATYSSNIKLIQHNYVEQWKFVRVSSVSADITVWRMECVLRRENISLSGSCCRSVGTDESLVCTATQKTLSYQAPIWAFDYWRQTWGKSPLKPECLKCHTHYRITCQHNKNRVEYDQDEVVVDKSLAWKVAFYFIIYKRAYLKNLWVINSSKWSGGWLEGTYEQQANLSQLRTLNTNK